jgi:hypothetical protein
MAVTITQQAPKMAMARSPIIYALNAGSEATGAGFMYQLKVFIWTGTIPAAPIDPTFILTKPPAPNARAHFDIGKLIEAYISSNPELITSTSGAQGSGSQVVAFQVRAGSVAIPDQQTSSISFASLGYTSPLEGVNGNRTAAGVYSMQPRQIHMKAGVRAWLGGFYDVENIAFGSITINANTSTNITFTPPYNATTQTSQKIVYFGIGTANLAQASLSFGSAYTVNVNRGDLAETSNLYTVNVVCGIHPAHTLYFINRFGAWDFICFYGNHKRGVETSASQMLLTQVTNTTGTVTYDTAKGSHRDFNSKGSDIYTLNSGYHHEDVRELVQDLLMSQHVIMIVEGSSTLIPVTVDSRSVTYQRKPTDDTINYELQVKVAYELINQMR